ncbi:putative atp-dependent clp protease proteolytic subunit [Diaporthe ampelina]|uniref:ATP-dependent Clp protease proteolytic subunit n=1 Tax=Diaporthe ampelina TaxID=1214573 RepID=A0A0G2HQ14_9PEZI|nr:putative atp-dependent clp protease proteolytic subunit [Diaporthe ampelina]
MPSRQGPVASIPMPYITEVTSGGWRTSDIFSKLLQERIVCLNGPIDDTVSAAIVAQLLWLESDAPEKPITMYINSPGGEISSGLAIYDTMSYIQSPVSTVCVGAAASMAAILLLGGEAGKRYALPHSSIMVHQPLGGTKGQASDIVIYATQIQRIRTQVNDIVRRHLNQSFGFDKYDAQTVNDMMERDRYLMAHEAKEAGIVDEILLKRPAKRENKDN